MTNITKQDAYLLKTWSEVAHQSPIKNILKTKHFNVLWQAFYDNFMVTLRSGLVMEIRGVPAELFFKNLEYDIDYQTNQLEVDGTLGANASEVVDKMLYNSYVVFKGE
jgi:hypothetical protein